MRLFARGLGPCRAPPMGRLVGALPWSGVVVGSGQAHGPLELLGLDARLRLPLGAVRTQDRPHHEPEEQADAHGRAERPHHTPERVHASRVRRGSGQAWPAFGRHTPKRLPWGSTRWANSMAPLSTYGTATVAPRDSARV